MTSHPVWLCSLGSCNWISLTHPVFCPGYYWCKGLLMLWLLWWPSVVLLRLQGIWSTCCEPLGSVHHGGLLTRDSVTEYSPVDFWPSVLLLPLDRWATVAILDIWCILLVTVGNHHLDLQTGRLCIFHVTACYYLSFFIFRIQYCRNAGLSRAFWVDLLRIFKHLDHIFCSKTLDNTQKFAILVE